MKNIAIVCAKGIGDGLTWMIIAHQLSLNGYNVVVYSDVLYELSEWFPNITIKPFPVDMAEFNIYNLVLADDHSCAARQSDQISTLVTIPREHFFDRKIQRINNMHQILNENFHIVTKSKDNGLMPLILKKKLKKLHVTIHPTASNSERNWGKEKFLKVAIKLINIGCSVSFTMHHSETKEWEYIKKYGIELPKFVNLTQTAAYIYNSSIFIGSDSGLGHLASNLGVPTISIFVRKSHSLNWRPGWSHGKVISPINILPGRALRQKIWKPLITPNMVIKAFKLLIKEIL